MSAPKENPAAPAVDVNAMIDELAAKAKIALEEYLKLDQEQVDAIAHAMALAGLDNHTQLAKMAVEETGRGVYEDKIIKNLFATEYIWHDIKDQKTVGVIDDDELSGIVQIAEPVGIVAGVTPVTNPTSTTMFKAMISAKARCPIIFGFHPSAQKCSAEAARIVRDAAIAAGASLSGRHQRPDEPPRRGPGSGHRRRGNGPGGIFHRQARLGRRPRQRALLHPQIRQPTPGLQRPDALQNF